LASRCKDWRNPEVAYQNACLRPRTSAGPCPVGAEAPDKPPIHHRGIPTCARTLLTISRLQRGGAGDGGVDRAEKRTSPTVPATPRDRQEADDHRIDDADHEGVMTDVDFPTAVLAQQMYGGHGYIAEHGMEQFVRDARIACGMRAPTAFRRLTSSGANCRATAAAPWMAFFRVRSQPSPRPWRRRGDEALCRAALHALGHLQQATTC